MEKKVQKSRKKYGNKRASRMRGDFKTYTHYYIPPAIKFIDEYYLNFQYMYIRI